MAAAILLAYSERSASDITRECKAQYVHFRLQNGKCTYRFADADSRQAGIKP